MGVTSASTVGWKNVPPSAWRLPPVNPRALANASAIWASTLSTAFVDQRSLLHAGLAPSPTFSFATALAQFGGERVVDPLLHIDAVGADAGLAHVAIFGRHGARHRGVEIGVVEYDERRVAAQLQPDLFHGPAACRISNLPTSVEPVKPTKRTAGWSHNTLPIAAASPVTKLNTPGGNPARSANSPSASAVSGVSSAGLTTHAQPAARAGANLRVIIAAGKFHGVIAATTPIGC